MNFIKRGVAVSAVAAGLVVGSAGLASAHGGDDGDSTNFENNSLIENVLNNNVINDNLNDNVSDNLNHNNVLSGNNIVINDVLGGGLLD